MGRESDMGEDDMEMRGFLKLTNKVYPPLKRAPSWKTHGEKKVPGGLAIRS